MTWNFPTSGPTNSSKEEEGTDYWISYADLMAGLLLAFVLILAAIQLVSSKKLLAKRKKVEQQKQELSELQTKIQNVLGIRAELMRRLKERFSQVEGEITFDDATGSIRLGTRILFDEGSAELSRRGKRKLRELMPIYFNALLGDSRLAKHVGRIIIQGHTNSNFSGVGGEKEAYLFNLELSQDRAFSAMQFVLRNEIGAEHGVRDLLQASGFSYSNRLYRTTDEGDEVEDKEASRRIEIRFRLKGERALRRLRRLFRNRLARELEKESS